MSANTVPAAAQSVAGVVAPAERETALPRSLPVLDRSLPDADADWQARRTAAIAAVAKAERGRDSARVTLQAAESVYLRERIALALIDAELCR